MQPAVVGKKVLYFWRARSGFSPQISASSTVVVDNLCTQRSSKWNASQRSTTRFSIVQFWMSRSSSVGSRHMLPSWFNQLTNQGIVPVHPGKILATRGQGKNKRQRTRTRKRSSASVGHKLPLKGGHHPPSVSFANH